MKDLISDLNKAFESRVRLGIMSVLMVNDNMDFIDLKNILNVTDGNLASHIKALERSNLITSTKQFLEKKPNTSYKITQEGKIQFQNHISALEKLLKL